MVGQKRSNDWGFPRWRAYSAAGRGATKVRLCDREGCSEVGDRPAPKAPNSKERWYFCEAHAAEYNKNWNYFAGLSPEEAARRAQDEESGASAFRSSAQWGWGGPGDGSRSRDEMRALDVLGLETDADTNTGNKVAADTFQKVQAAYEVLRKAEERKSGKAA
jgi:hypothetical protein